MSRFRTMCPPASENEPKPVILEGPRTKSAEWRQIEETAIPTPLPWVKVDRERALRSIESHTPTDKLPPGEMEAIIKENGGTPSV